MSLLLGRQRRSAFGWSPGRVTFTPGTPPLPTDVPMGVHTSLQKVAVWSCVNLTATMAEVLPLDVFSGSGQDRRPRPMPAWLADLGADGHGLPDWRYQLVFSAMLRGNGIGEVVERDARTGQPRLIVLANPDTVRADPDAEGRLQWTIGRTAVERESIWHKRVHAVPGSVMGLSPIAMHAQTLGLALSSMEFGRRWFTDGAHPSAMLTNEGQITQEMAAEAKSRFMAALRGNREPVAMGYGWRYTPISVAPNESQFLETQGYTSAECARIFGPGYAEVLGYETGGSLTYSTLEQASLHLLTYALDPWLERIERWLSALLPQPQYVKFNRGALVRTDLLTRYRAHEIALRNKFKVINEVRDLEDMSPAEWGNTPADTTLDPAADPAAIAGGPNA